MSFHGIGIWMILISKFSFESGPQDEKGPGVECFLCPRQARARQNSLIFGTFLARTRAARAVNILVLDPFYSEDTLQRKLCLFLMASSINEWCSKCFGGGWGPLQNPKHGLRIVMPPQNPKHGSKNKWWGAIPSPFPTGPSSPLSPHRTNPKKPSQTPKKMLGSDTLKNPGGFCRGLRWPWTRVWDFVVATLGPKFKTHD